MAEIIKYLIIHYTFQLVNDFAFLGYQIYPCFIHTLNNNDSVPKGDK